MGWTVELRFDERGSDDARLDLLHRQLRLQLHGVSEVEVVPAAQPAVPVPENARGVDVAALGTLTVAVLGSGGLTALVASARDWLGRGRHDARSVRLEIAGDVLELNGATAGEHERLVALFLARHEGGDAS
jgi:hypothetical protein